MRRQRRSPVRRAAWPIAPPPNRHHRTRLSPILSRRLSRRPWSTCSRPSNRNRETMPTRRRSRGCRFCAHRFPARRQTARTRRPILSRSSARRSGRSHPAWACRAQPKCVRQSVLHQCYCPPQQSLRKHRRLGCAGMPWPGRPRSRPCARHHRHRRHTSRCVC